jgi:predicted nucleic acid-binding protein
MPLSVRQFVAGQPLPQCLYLDANVLIAFIDRNHQKNIAAIDLIGEAIASQCEILVSLLALDEVWHSLAEIWGQAETPPRRVSGALMKQYAPRLNAKTQNILDLGGVIVLPGRADDGRDIVAIVMKLLSASEMGARDLFHAGYALHRIADGLATTDDDFGKLVLPDARDFAVIKL